MDGNTFIYYFYFYSYLYCYYYYYHCCIFICDFIAKVAIVNGRMCSADTEHLHPSKVTIQLGEWLQEKWFFCPISLIFCASSKLTAHESFDFKLLFWKNGNESICFFFSTYDLSKIFCTLQWYNMYANCINNDDLWIFLIYLLY